MLSGAGGADDVFEPVLRDILARLDGRPVDLYVMSHEHLDHVQGLPYADRAGLHVPIEYAWLTASAEPGYHDRFPEAGRRLAIARTHYALVRAAAEQRGLLAAGPVHAFLANNDPLTTEACVAFLRGMATTTRYVHRGFQPIVGRDHPFAEAKLSVWAPEEDTARYFGRIKPFVGGTRRRAPRKPPSGVEPRAFAELMDFLEAGLFESMLAIDRAANDTSVVFALEWRGWRLLFPGDAELRSWQVMARHRRVRPVHLLKVGHHGSRNATPPEAILDRLLPMDRPDDRPRRALLSTWPETYSGVPDELTIARLRRRVDEIVTTTAVGSGSSVTIELDG